MVVETAHPRFDTVRQLASPVKVGEPRAGHRRAPRRDEDRVDILRDVLGYPAERWRARVDPGDDGPA
jgi:hypothetical protein